MDFNGAIGHIIHRLRQELNPSLSYHSVEHTLDVLEATSRLADSENTEPGSKILLETAAAYHDAGMLIQYQNHESASVEIAKQTLPAFGFSKSEINEIANLIMVTKLPQRPYNHFEQIICDADLDYLGRDDFFIHSFKLKLEWQANQVKDLNLVEWFDIQIKFLTDHQYFTKSAILLRQKKKVDHLEEIKKLISQNRIIK
jgi:predicted metal-dependent HD superfamily phosphohydrolase